MASSFRLTTTCIQGGDWTEDQKHPHHLELFEKNADSSVDVRNTQICRENFMSLFEPN